MKKKMALLNVLIVVVSFVAAFLLCAFQLRSQYQREFSRRLDAVLSLSSLESEQFAENPQKEAQRLGSILRPKERKSSFYTIVSKFTVEEALKTCNDCPS